MRLTQFGTYVFPLYNKRDTLGPGDSSGSLLELPGGGAWDGYQDDEAPERPTTYSTAFEIVAATAALVDTELGYIRARRGLRRRLWATMADGTMRFCWARLARIRHERAWRNTLFVPVELTFEVPNPGWNGTGHGAQWRLDEGEVLDAGLYLDYDAAVALEADGSTTITLANGGNRTVNNVVISLTAGAASISNIRFQLSPCDFTFTGTVAAGKTLDIDCGTRSVLNDGADAYASLTLGGAHSVADWLQLAAGSNDLVMTYSGNAGGDATVELEYYDGWE